MAYQSPNIFLHHRLDNELFAWENDASSSSANFYHIRKATNKTHPNFHVMNPFAIGMIDESKKKKKLQASLVMLSLIGLHSGLNTYLKLELVSTT